MEVWYGYRHGWNARRVRAVVAVATTTITFAVLAMKTHNSTERTPPPAWTVAASDDTRTWTIVSDSLLVQDDRSITALDLQTGRPRGWSVPLGWPSRVMSYDAHSITVSDVSGGFASVDPQTGGVHRFAENSDPSQGYRDGVLVMLCLPDPDSSCRLLRWSTTGQQVFQSQPLPADARPTVAPLPDTSIVVGRYDPKPSIVVPKTIQLVPVDLAAMPAFVSVNTGDAVLMIDTSTGQVGSRFPTDQWNQVFVAGEHLLQVGTSPQDGRCRYTIDVLSLTGTRVWQWTALDPGTASGACQQNRPLPVLGDIFWAREGEREALLSATYHREIWVGDKDASVVALGKDLAVVSTPDHEWLQLVNLSTGQVTCALHEAATNISTLAISDRRFVLGDKNNRVLTCSRRQGTDPREAPRFDEGRLLGTGTLCAAGPDGVAIEANRKFSYVAFPE